MAQYFDNVELKSNIKKIIVNILGHSFSFYTDNGVFCKDRLDYGTRLLLENIDWENINGDILDVGCGYGPIGIIASKITDNKVYMCDVNKNLAKAKSLGLFMNKFSVSNAIRFTEDNFSYKKGIKYIPIYAVFCLKDYL